MTLRTLQGMLLLTTGGSKVKGRIRIGPSPNASLAASELFVGKKLNKIALIILES